MARLDGYIRVYDPLSSPPTLLRSLHAQHLSAGDALIAARGNFEAQYLTPNRVVLEDDLLVAAIGRKVFCCRAKGTKGRGAGAGAKKGPGGGRAYMRALDLRSAHRDAKEDHAALRQERRDEEEAAELALATAPSRLERQVEEALEEMGLDDADGALQYAMMLSMEEQGRGRDGREGQEEWEGEGEGEGYAEEDEDEEGYERDEEDGWVGAGAGVRRGQEEANEDGMDEGDMSDGAREALRAVREYEEAERRAGGGGWA